MPIRIKGNLKILIKLLQIELYCSVYCTACKMVPQTECYCLSSELQHDWTMETRESVACFCHQLVSDCFCCPPSQLPLARVTTPL